MKVAVLGSGGREHALAWKLSQELKEENVYFLPGNPGFKHSYRVNIHSFEALEAFCMQEDIGLLIVGPEEPLARGIVNYFANTSISVFGPNKEAAKLESSKIFAKNFMQKHKVATASFEPFNNTKAAIKKIQALGGHCVIKYDGLAGGKGVYVCNNFGQAEAALDAIHQKYGESAPLLIEERLQGQEVSIMGVCDGKTFKPFFPVKDYKQAFDGDQGPNTGGMGAYGPARFYGDDVQASIDESIIKPTLKGFQQEDIRYRGFLYFGIMLTDQGPRLLEYNVRMGDPETQVIMPALQTKLLDIVQSTLSGNLHTLHFTYNQKVFVNVVLASGGYPQLFKTGKPITGLIELEASTKVFHAGTKNEDNSLCTNGGRVLNVVCSAHTLDEAREKAYSECNKVFFDAKMYRKDIGLSPHLVLS